MCRKFEKSNVSYCNVAPTNFYCASAALTKNAVYFGSVFCGVFSIFTLSSYLSISLLILRYKQKPIYFPYSLSLSLSSPVSLSVYLSGVYILRSPHTKDISSLPFFPCILHSEVSVNEPRKKYPSKIYFLSFTSSSFFTTDRPKKCIAQCR